jgi:Development and cell death domain.
MYDGYVFYCNKKSQQQCLNTRHFTCSDQPNKPPEQIKEGSVVFLYNTDEKTLLGPFTALTEGAEELDAGTWRMDVDTKIPSEDLKVTWENLHLIQNADKELPFLAELKICRLGTTQTQRVLDLLRQGPLYAKAKDEEKP